MSRPRRTGTLPQPPWSYAPSEVAEWLASTAGSRRAREPRYTRQVRVRGFVGPCPASVEARLVRRLTRLGFERLEGSGHAPHVFRHLRHASSPALFLGKLGETRVRVRLGRAGGPEVRVTFIPRVSLRTASKLVTRLGLRLTDGMWT